MAATLLGIDWGTSNRRAYLVGREGVLAHHADEQGLLAVQGGGNGAASTSFADSLSALRVRMGIGSEVPVVMSGMVGSASGWQEVPYLHTDVSLERLPEHLAALSGQPGCSIVPGYRSDRPHIDVMRGEETQLLGAVAMGVRAGWVVLPGTHSKWVHLEDGCIGQFSTFMTGELFATLGKTGTLASMLGTGDDLSPSFEAGLAEARAGQPLSHSLFGVRARVVTHALPSSEARAFVSGLLIGSEFAQAERMGGAADPGVIHLVGSAALSQRYVRAAAFFGVAAKALDPDQAYLNAMQQFLEKV
ncbi:MAG: 2-dehydro-3-deoxygalactonokinase [Gammaproteobacteria bacterium]